MNKASIDLACGTKFINSSIDISWALSKDLRFTIHSFDICANISSVVSSLLLVFLSINKTLFTFISSIVANFLPIESIYPNSVIVSFASSSIFWVNIALGLL